MAAVTSSVTSVVRYRATTRTGGGLLGAPLAPNRARPSRCAHDEQHAATGRYGVPGRVHGCWRRDQAEGQCPGQVLFPQVDGGLSGCHAPGPTFGWQAEPRQQDASPRQTRTGVTASPLLRSRCPAQPQVTAVLATLPGPWPTPLSHNVSELPREVPRAAHDVPAKLSSSHDVPESPWVERYLALTDPDPRASSLIRPP